MLYYSAVDNGYPHDGRADKNPYPHDRRATTGERIGW